MPTQSHSVASALRTGRFAGEAYGAKAALIVVIASAITLVVFTTGSISARHFTDDTRSCFCRANMVSL